MVARLDKTATQIETFGFRRQKTRRNQKLSAKVETNDLPLMKKILRKNPNEDVKPFPANEIIWMMLIQQMTPGVIVWLCGFILRRGSGIYMKRKVVDVPCTLLIYIVVLLLATYFILQVILATPLFMLYCFFAIYTRKGFIAFWNSMPIFQGIGFALLLLEISEEVYLINNVGVLSLVSLYTYGLTTKTKWQECKFEIPESLQCIPVNSRLTNVTCPPKNYLISSKIFFRLHYVRDEVPFEDMEWGVFNLKMFALSSTIWVLLGICLIHGLHWFQRYWRSALKLAVYAIGFVLFCTVIISLKYEPGMVLYRGIKVQILDIVLWVRSGSIILDKIGPSCLMYFAKFMPPDVKATNLAIKVSSSKLIIVCLLIIVQACVVTIVAAIYGYPYNTAKSCMQLRGLDIPFANIPDTLTFLPAHNFFIAIYLASLFTLTFAGTFYTFISCLESLLEFSPKLEVFRNRIILIGMIYAMFLSTPWCTTAGRAELGPVWFYLGTMILRPTLVFLSTALVTAIYTINKVEIDYLFLYGTLPRKFWTSLLKVLPISTMILVILILFALSKIEVKDKALLRAVCVLNAFTLSPIFGVMAYLYWKKWKKGESMRFIKPTDDWGPPDVTQRMHRNKYRPDKEIQSNKTDLNCTHHCLVDSKLYLIETVQKRMHFDSVEEIMRGNRKEYGV